MAIGLPDLVKKTNSNQLERQTAGGAGEDYLEEICGLCAESYSEQRVVEPRLFVSWIDLVS